MIRDIEKELEEARQRNAARLHKRLPDQEKAVELNLETYRTRTGIQKSVRQYGITREQWLEMVRTQESSCAICGVHVEMASALAIDHCHETGTVRGLLCRSCNIGLGFFRDNISLLAKAINYLTLPREERDKSGDN